MTTSDRFTPSTLTARAVAAAVSVASAYGIEVDNPHIMADAYSLRVHLQPAPIVARVSTITPVLRYPIETWLAREISVVEFLASRGVPVIAPSDLLPAIPHEFDGLFMSFWRYVQPASDIIPEAAIVAEMLAQLHAVLRDYPGELPFLAPPLNDIPNGLKRLYQAGDILPESDLKLLQNTYDDLLSQIDRSVNSLQPLHGDANTSNLIATVEGLLWNDFEDTCTGAIAWDLINLDDAARAAYPNAPDLATLEPYFKLRQLHAIVWVYTLLPEFSGWLEPARMMLDALRDRSNI